MSSPVGNSRLGSDAPRTISVAYFYPPLLARAAIAIRSDVAPPPPPPPSIYLRIKITESVKIELERLLHSVHF